MRQMLTQQAWMKTTFAQKSLPVIKTSTTLGLLNPQL
jgi:hypothetical protein